MEKREQIRRWFLAKEIEPIAYIGLIIFNLAGLWLLTIGDTIGQKGTGLFTIALFGGLGYWRYSQNKKIASENELDSWLEEDIQAIIKNRPYDKLGISKEDLVAESLLVVGPVYWNISGFDVNDILMKKGKDSFNRYSVWTIQVFAFTENYLCSYKCHYNWIKNTYINESTNEFFYKDVVSVKTDTISSAYTLMNGQRLVHSEAFQLKLAGDEITVITNDASLNTSSVMVSKAEKAVQSIRAMLRDKKK
jgi:hypothetical protein